MEIMGILKRYWRWIVGVIGGIGAIFLTFFSGGIFVVCLSGACIPIALTFWGIITGIGTIFIVLFKKIKDYIRRLFK